MRLLIPAILSLFLALPAAAADLNRLTASEVAGLSPAPDLPAPQPVFEESSLTGGAKAPAPQALSEALAKRILLPGHVVQMLRVGEESGRLADSADRIGGFYEAKLETSLGRLTAVIGPAMMIGVSLLVAWLIVSVMTALISVNDLLV